MPYYKMYEIYFITHHNNFSHTHISNSSNSVSSSFKTNPDSKSFLPPPNLPPGSTATTWVMATASSPVSLLHSCSLPAWAAAAAREILPSVHKWSCHRRGDLLVSGGLQENFTEEAPLGKWEHLAESFQGEVSPSPPQRRGSCCGQTGEVVSWPGEGCVVALFTS